MKKLIIAFSAAAVLCIIVVVASLSLLSGSKKTVPEQTDDQNIRSEAADVLAENKEASEKTTAESSPAKDEKDTASDLSEAECITVKDGDDITISKAGVYVLSGTAEGAVITVSADKENDKVELVLDGLNITNSNFPAIYVLSAKKTVITLNENSDNRLIVTDEFISDGDVNTDGVIFSKDDLTIKGTGTLNIDSSYNGIVCKDDLKIKGGTYVIKSVKDSIEVNNTAEISDGSFNLDAGGKGIQADEMAVIDGGTFLIDAVEGIESTYVQINAGDINIYAYDDGINASRKSDAYEPMIEINGGDINVEVAPGDTDALDANGSIYINGGTVCITARSAFDYDISGELNGGSVYVNGEQVYELIPSMMGGGRGGFQDGGRGGFPNSDRGRFPGSF